MSDTQPVASNEAALQEAFPAVDPGALPVGGRILVQWRAAKKTVTSSGIVLIEETKETEKWNNQVAKVIAVGPLAFKKRDTLEPWPEGNWIMLATMFACQSGVATAGKYLMVTQRSAKPRFLVCLTITK